MTPGIDLISTIEDSIVSQLSCSNIGARIDNDARSNQVSPKARVVVQFLDESPVSSGNRAKSPQAVALQFTLTVELTDQRIGSHKNVYPIIDAIKAALIGFEPERGDRIRYDGTTRQDFPTDSGIYWRYVITISTNAVWGM